MMLKPTEKTYVQMQAGDKKPGTSQTFTVYGVTPSQLAPLFRKFVETHGRQTSEGRPRKRSA